jgi:hypothetical protein
MTARNLGIYIDADLSMQIRVVKSASTCSAVLCNVCNIQRSVLESLVVSLVLSRLD